MLRILPRRPTVAALAAMACLSTALPGSAQERAGASDVDRSVNASSNAGAAPAAPRRAAAGAQPPTAKRSSSVAAWNLFPAGKFVYRADNKRIAEVLQDFAASQGLPAVVDEGLEGSVSGSFDLAPEAFLDAISKAYGMIWYHDGTALYFYPGKAIQSRLFRLQGFSWQQVTDLLKSLEIGDKRYSVRYDKGNKTLLVAGPPRHVELVAAAVEALDAGALADASDKVVRVFALRYAAASDRVLGGATVPGIASILQDLYGTQATGAPDVMSGARPDKAMMDRAKGVMPTLPAGQLTPAAAAGKHGKSTARAEQPPGVDRPLKSPVDQSDETPSFRADEGTNTVIVKGLVSRMRDYEALIRRLDQKPVLVELEAMIIDVSADSVHTLGVDWSVSGAANSISIASPSVGNGSDSSGTFTLGTVVSDAGRQFLMRIQALQGEGKARIVSKPSVLGVANRPAVMSDKRVATVRVSGNLEANLFQVEAGTLLQVTPQVSSTDGTNWVKLSLYIEDGSFETARVDQVPVIKRTEIRTEAQVREGESLLIGGVTTESVTRHKSGVPGLSRLPVIGGLFRTSSNQLSRTERMFLITPRLRGTLTGPAAVVPLKTAEAAIAPAAPASSAAIGVAPAAAIAPAAPATAASVTSQLAGWFRTERRPQAQTCCAPFVDR